MLLQVAYSSRASQNTGVGYGIISGLCVMAKISDLCLHRLQKWNIVEYNNLSGDKLVLDTGIICSVIHSICEKAVLIPIFFLLAL